MSGFVATNTAGKMSWRFVENYPGVSENAAIFFWQLGWFFFVLFFNSQYYELLLVVWSSDVDSVTWSSVILVKISFASRLFPLPHFPVVTTLLKWQHQRYKDRTTVRGTTLARVSILGSALHRHVHCLIAVWREWCHHLIFLNRPFCTANIHKKQY